MHEFYIGGQAIDGRQFFFDQIFDRFNVVVGCCFNGFYLSCIVNIEAINERINCLVLLFAQRRQLWNGGFRSQALEPAEFHQYAKPNESIFAEELAQGASVSRVSTINGAYGCEFFEF